MSSIQGSSPLGSTPRRRRTGRRLAASALASLLVAAGLAAGASPAYAAPSDLCAQVGYSAGWRGEALEFAVAIALAESSCNPGASNRQGNVDAEGSTDRGLWQINDFYHPDVTNACAYDAQCNANEAFRISSGGTNWQPWSTYNRGHHWRHMDEARAAVARLGHPGGPGPAPVVHPVESGRVVSARSADGRLEVFSAGADGVHHA
ncbi:transglycosylase SLT domain-containing protein, partial [Streptomyces nojiriensis]|uniref:transglycosylase SLT domain-containing protein n=1 Tax=Streptomyces nojiriensis TaxID=66374 RepID=UPI0035E15F81